MSIEAIKQELANLDETSRHQIMAFLVAMDDLKDPQYRASIARKIDDKDPSHWMTLEELEQRLSLREDEPRE
jgi:hypothetical protein